MKTAMDVIHRIQWDKMLEPHNFHVGYIDRWVIPLLTPSDLFYNHFTQHRFKGVVEERFTGFSNWGDLASADFDALAIPQHRIQYFKYKDTKVWDKNERIDLVFGSVGAGDEDILDVIDRVDDR